MIKIQEKTPQTTEVCNYILTRREQGNSGYMVIWDENYFQPYDLVEITQDETHQFLIDKVKTLQQGENLTKQEVFLQDTIHFFDKMFPPSRRFSKNKMASEFLDVYKVDEKGTPLFDYVNMYLLDITMPQKEYDGENLTAIIKDIAKRINCKANVEIRDGAVPLVTFTPMTQRVGTTAIDYDPNHMQTEMETTNYATEILGKVKNAVVEDGRGTWFPSKNYGITARTEEYRFDEPSAAFLFNDRIWSILEVVIPDGIAYLEDAQDTVVKYMDLTITSVTHPDFLDGSRKQRVVSKAEWDYLYNPDDAADSIAQDQTNTIYYQIGGDRVENLWTLRKGTLTSDILHLSNAYSEAFTDFTNTTTLPYLFELNYTAANWKDLPVKFKYVSQRDLDYVVEKMDVANKYQSTLLSNQLSTLVELNQHASAMSLLAERVANLEMTFKETTDGTLYKLGNWTTDNRVFTTVKRELDGDYTHQEIEVSKNFANIDVETSVSRESYPFQITDKQIKTNFKTKEYIEFSKDLKAIDSYMTETARNIAVNIFDYNTTYNRPIFDAQIIPTIPKYIIGDWMGKAIHIPVMPFSDNTIGLNVHIFHPTFAGYTLEDDKRGVIEYKEESPTGEIKDLLSYNIEFGTENVIDDSGTNRLYPLVTTTTGLIDVGDIVANLDPNCLLAHTHNIHVVTDYPEEIILNGKFGFYNNLVKELESPSLEVYVAQALWDVFTTEDKKPRLNDTLYASGVVSYNSTVRLLSVTHPNTTDNIAIVHNGDIILALNGIDSCYINFLRNRAEIIGLIFYQLSASATGLANVSGTANLFYVALQANATNLAQVSGTTGALTYTSKIYRLNASATGLATVTGTAPLEYTGVSYVLNASAINLSNVSGTATLEYTFKEYVLSASASGISNLTGTANFQYTDRTYDLSASATGVSNLSGIANLSYTYQVWDYIGTSSQEQDGLVDLGTSGTDTCRSIFAAEDDMIQAGFEANDYAVGFVMKVEHDYEDPTFGTSPCTPYYYRSIEVTE